MSKLWDDQDGFFYDRLRKRDGSTFTVRARSMVGLLPIFAAVQLDATLWERLPMFRERARWYIENKPGLAEFLHMPPTDERPRLISLVGKSRMKQILACMLDETEFLSPYGLRSLSRYHREHPPSSTWTDHVARLDYEPGEFSDRTVRRQFELARTDLVSAQFSRNRVATTSAYQLWGRLHG